MPELHGFSEDDMEAKRFVDKLQTVLLTALLGLVGYFGTRSQAFTDAVLKKLEQHIEAPGHRESALWRQYAERRLSEIEETQRAISKILTEIVKK